MAGNTPAQERDDPQRDTCRRFFDERIDWELTRKFKIIVRCAERLG